MRSSPLLWPWGWACLRTLLLTLSTLCASAASQKHVLVIQSFGWGFEPNHTFAGLLRTELASQMAEPVDFFEFARQSLAASTAKSWFTVTETWQQRQIADGMVKAATELLTLTMQRQKVGPGSEQEGMIESG